MTTDVEKVSRNALALSDEQREELVRRIAKIESGEAVLHDAEQHAKQLRAKYE